MVHLMMKSLNLDNLKRNVIDVFFMYEKVKDDLDTEYS